MVSRWCYAGPHQTVHNESWWSSVVTSIKEWRSPWLHLVKWAPGTRSVPSRGHIKKELPWRTAGHFLISLRSLFFNNFYDSSRAQLALLAQLIDFVCRFSPCKTTTTSAVGPPRVINSGAIRHSSPSDRFVRRYTAWARKMDFKTVITMFCPVSLNVILFPQVQLEQVSNFLPLIDSPRRIHSLAFFSRIIRVGIARRVNAMVPTCSSAAATVIDIDGYDCAFNLWRHT